MAELKETHKYDDIIHLSRPVSGRHAAMSMLDRAAQFAPFAALTGHSDVLRKAAVRTEDCIELTESAKAIMNEKLCRIAENIESQPEVLLTVFEQDIHRGGGNYVPISGRVKRIDTTFSRILFTDDRSVYIDDIFEIICPNLE